MIVAKFYTDIRTTAPYSQQFIQSEVVIEKDINTFGTANFTMQVIEGIEKDQKCELYEVSEVGTDTKIFTGYVYDVKPIWQEFFSIEIELRSEKGLFDKRIFTKDIKQYTADTRANRPTDCIFFVQNKAYLNGSVIYTMKERVFDDFGNCSIAYSTVRLKDLSYVQVIDEGALYRYNGAGVPTFWRLGTGLYPSEILADVLSVLNTDFGENWTFETNITPEILVDIKKGDNIYSYLDELCKNISAVRDVRDGVVMVKDYFADKTSGQYYTEVVFNGQQTSYSNIKKIEINGQKQRFNYIFLTVKDRLYGPFKDSGFYGMGSFQARDGNPQQAGQKMLQDLNKYVKTYKVEIESNSINADIGEKVKLVVENTNSYFNINSDVVISKKKITYNKGKNEEYELQTFNTVTFTTETFLRSIQQVIKYNNVPD